MATPVIDEYNWNASGVPCACGYCDYSENRGSIPYDVGVVQGKGALPLLDPNSGKIEYIDWLDDYGYPYVNVVYICNPCDTEMESYMADNDEYISECFVSLLEDICDSLEDQPPLSNPGELTTCDTCGSSVLQAEPVILLRVGRLTLPDRRPPGALPIKFIEDARMAEYILCLRCAKAANMVRDPGIWGGRIYEVTVGWHDDA